MGRRERRLAELGTKKVMRSLAGAHRDMRPVVALLILPDAQLKYSRRCHATTPDAENSSHRARQSADRGGTRGRRGRAGPDGGGSGRRVLADLRSTPLGSPCHGPRYGTALVGQPERELGLPFAHVRLLAGVSQVDLQPTAPPLAAVRW